MMPELLVLLVVATLVGGLVLMLRRTPHEVADDEPPTLNTRGDE